MFTDTQKLIIGLDSLKEEIKKDTPKTLLSEEMNSILTSTDFNLTSKKAIAKSIDDLNSNIIPSKLAVKIQYKLIKKWILNLKDRISQLSWRETSLREIEVILETLSELDKKRFHNALKGIDSYQGLYIGDYLALFIVILDKDTIWIPFYIDSDIDGDLTNLEVSKINLFLSTTISKQFKSYRNATLIGPRGGRMDRGAIYTSKELPKDKAEKLLFKLPSKCNLEF